MAAWRAARGRHSWSGFATGPTPWPGTSSSPLLADDLRLCPASRLLGTYGRGDRAGGDAHGLSTARRLPIRSGPRPLSRLAGHGGPQQGGRASPPAANRLRAAGGDSDHRVLEQAADQHSSDAAWEAAFESSLLRRCWMRCGGRQRPGVPGLRAGCLGGLVWRRGGPAHRPVAERRLQSQQAISQRLTGAGRAYREKADLRRRSSRPWSNARPPAVERSMPAAGPANDAFVAAMTEHVEQACARSA